MADLIIAERYREAHRNGLQRYLESRQGDVLGRELINSPGQPDASVYFAPESDK